MPKKKAIATTGNSTLDDRQERFCREYLVDFNASRAAVASGYSQKTAGSQASDLLKRPNIQNRIKQIAEEILDTSGDMVKRIICELQLLAFGDMRDFMTWDQKGITWKDSKDLGDKTRMVQEVKETYSASGGSRTIKLYDKQKALEMLARYQGLFKDTMKHEGEITARVVLKIIPNGREKK